MKSILLAILVLSFNAFSQSLGSGTTNQPNPSLNSPTNAQPQQSLNSNTQQPVPNTGVGTAVLPPANLGSGTSFSNSGVNDSNFTFNTQSFDPVTGQQVRPGLDTLSPNLNTSPTPIPDNQDLIFGTGRQAQEAEPTTGTGSGTGFGTGDGVRTFPGQDTNISQ